MLGYLSQTAIAASSLAGNVAFIFKLPPLWVYFVLYLDEFEKIPFVIRHYKKKGWLRDITRN